MARNPRGRDRVRGRVKGWGWFGLAGGVASLLGYLAIPHFPIGHAAGALLGLTPSPLLLLPCFLLALVGLASALRARFRFGSLASLGILGAAAWLLAGPFRLPANPPAHDLRVLTLNVHYQSFEMPTLLRLIQEQEVDVVLLQEIRRNGRSPGEYLFDRLPGWYKRTRGEVAILARWPVSNLAVVPLRGSSQRVVLSAQVMAPKRFRATVVHWSRPRLRRTKPSLPEQAQAQTRDFLATQVAIQDSPLPQILAGDFNCPPHHPLSHALGRRLTNAFGSSGSGPGWTFPADRPVVRIDHIYAGDGLQPVRAWVGPNVGSDHLPVLADLIFGP